MEAQIIQFPLSTTSDDPERTMAQREIQHFVEQAIDDLPEAYRIVFIARVIEEMSVREIAALFALRPETVKTRLRCARSNAHSEKCCAAQKSGSLKVRPRSTLRAFLLHESKRTRVHCLTLFGFGNGEGIEG